MSDGVSQSNEEEREKLLQEKTKKQSRMQSYGTTPGPGVGHSSNPSAPPAFEGLGFPGGAHGNQYPPPGSGYAPAGQGYPPAEKGYPPAGPGYPPAGPGYPPAGQGYPPAGAGYPPAGQGYPPGGPGYPPTGQGYQQGGQSGFPSGGQSYPPGQPSSADDPFSPPPAGFLDPVAGYDSITFDDIPLLPPSYDDATRPVEPRDRKPLSGLPVISQEQARSAMLEHCAANCCYGTTAAQQMTVLDMSSTSAFHYTLETFTEQRSTAWAQVPFTGAEPLDTAMNGPAPLPWDIPLYASEKFKTEKKKLEVPHTACVKPCHRCHGSGYTTCVSCHGMGRSHCTSCGGSGRQHFGSDHRCCSFCGGSGHRQCFSCGGSGRKRCSTCHGRGQLKWFIQLTVTWTNHFEDYILERTAMPDELIRKASGQVAFQEEQPWLYPVNHCPEQSVNRASVELIEKHRKAFPNERQLLQRHVIRIVPVTEVKCRWKQDSFTLFVHGLDNRVYTADYPQMCCWGCEIL